MSNLDASRRGKKCCTLQAEMSKTRGVVGSGGKSLYCKRGSDIYQTKIKTGEHVVDLIETGASYAKEQYAAGR